MELVLLWWSMVLIMGLATFPIAFILFKHFPDKGYVFAKVLSLLILGYLTWILGYISFSGGTIFVSFMILLAISACLLWTWIGPAFFTYLKKDVWYLLLVEFLFLAAFLIAGAYKMRTHDIVGTEKPMDFAFINGIISSQKMPPQDPWLSGGSISYYYFGYLIVAILCKISNVTSGEAFNLAIALTWALSVAAAFSLVFALTRRYRYSFLSSISLAILGNLDYWHRAIQSFRFPDLRVPYYNVQSNGTGPGGLTASWNFLSSPLQHSWDYFQASRIIPVPPADKMINEFPSFSFFLSDLHPHVMGIPFFLLAMGLTFNVMKSSFPGPMVFGGRKIFQYFHWFLFILVFGGLFFMNSWDFPTLILLLGSCLAFQQWWSNEKNFISWLKSMTFLGVPIVFGWVFLYFPFLLRLQSQAQGIGFVRDRTDIYHFFVIFGFFMVAVIPTLVGRLNQRSDKNGRNRSKKADLLECTVCGKEGTGKKFCGHCGGEVVFLISPEITPFPNDGIRNFLMKLGSLLVKQGDPWRGWITFALFTFVISFLNFIPLKLGVVLLAFIVVVFCFVSLTSKTDSKEMVFATLLVLIAFSLVFGCEVLFVRDMFWSGALYRMNTMFKFHYQVWILLSIAIGPFLKWFFEYQWPQWAFWRRALWLFLAGFVFFGAGMYPLLAFTARMNGTSAELATMDGAVYYERAFYSDYEVVKWIKTNVKPVSGKTPVILEAWGGSYHQEFARIATNTGYPTILGWDFHEVQWRGSGDKAVVRGGSNDDTVSRRQGDIDLIYTSTDINLTRELLKKYVVDYVYVGDSEKQKYSANVVNLSKFSQVGSVAYQVGNSVLYKINL